MVEAFGIVSVAVECAYCHEINYFTPDDIDTYDDYIVDKQTLEPKRCFECQNKLYK